MIVDLIFMLISLFIIMVQEQYILTAKTPKISAVREFVFSIFGNQNINDNEVVQRCQNMELGICEYKPGKTTADEMYALLMTQIFKPVFVLLVRFYKGEVADSVLYTHSTFITRLFFDIIIFIMNFNYMSDVTNILSPQYQANLLPIFLELPIYFFSVRSAYESTKSIHYQIISDKIQTQEENDEMWSTETDSELDEALQK